MLPYSFALDFMNRIDMPKEAVAQVTAVCEQIYSCGEARKLLDRLKWRYLYVNRHYRSVKSGVCKLAKMLDVPEYTCALTFLILCLRVTKARYESRGYSDKVFYESFADLKYKAIECKNVKGVWGTFVASWYDGFFSLKRFAYGRFQYELMPFFGFGYSKFGASLGKRSRVVNFHIPSCGSITYEKRLESYKLAYEHYRELFEGPVVFVCASWLLYRQHYDFLPEGCNILDFMDDFDIVYSLSFPKFLDGWRVFGSKADLPYRELPEDTSLQRAFKKRLLSGKLTGMGYGVLVFDGEKILTRTQCHNSAVTEDLQR